MKHSVNDLLIIFKFVSARAVSENIIENSALSHTFSFKHTFTECRTDVHTIS